MLWTMAATSSCHCWPALHFLVKCCMALVGLRTGLGYCKLSCAGLLSQTTCDSLKLVFAPSISPSKFRIVYPVQGG